MLFANIEMFIAINKFVSDLFIAINKFYKMFLFIWEAYWLYLKVVALIGKHNRLLLVCHQEQRQPYARREVA